MTRISIYLLITLLCPFLLAGQSQIRKKNTARPENIILMIGDGMGLTQISAAMAANHDSLNLERCTFFGFAKTKSADDYVTDSGASGTALATGKKTKNHSIGVDTSGKPLTSILELAEKQGMATGMVTTCDITHATPASFIAHQPNRKMLEEIADDFLKTDIDVFIGGGRKRFENRKDGRNLLDSLHQKGYKVILDKDSLSGVAAEKIAALLYEEHPPKYSDGRGELLSTGVKKALEVLDRDSDGFFLMVEGSQIDWGGHENDISYVVSELLDFDRAVGQVLDFAETDSNTLLIVTADHETGGLSLPWGDLKTGEVKAAFSVDQHTGVMVPVFAFGPGAELFSGIYENTGIFDRMKELIRKD